MLFTCANVMIFFVSFPTRELRELKADEARKEQNEKVGEMQGLRLDRSM